MGRGLRIIILSCLVFVVVANLAFFAFAQNGVWSNGWVAIKVFGKQDYSDYKFRGFADLYKYISTFPGLTNSISVVNNVAAIISGEVSYTGWTVVDAILGVLTIIGSIAELIFAFIGDIINMFIWLFGFFIPNWF